MVHLYGTVFGTRVNLSYIALVVAFYDIYHICLELVEKFSYFWLYEDAGISCSENFLDFHCTLLYSDIAIYVLDFIFTSFLIYGSNRVEKIWHFPFGVRGISLIFIRFYLIFTVEANTCICLDHSLGISFSWISPHLHSNFRWFY